MRPKGDGVEEGRGWDEGGDNDHFPLATFSFPRLRVLFQSGEGVERFSSPYHAAPPHPVPHTWAPLHPVGLRQVKRSLGVAVTSYISYFHCCCYS